jgi:ubiquinone/menaquinone biosynthesis C-methylase UbiE
MTMTELQLIVDLHKPTDRQGPGSKQDTLRALAFSNLENSGPLKVADLGCGSGGQTITLAQQLDATITAVDVFPDFLDELRERAQQEGVSDKISPLKASMAALPFDHEAFDLLWSEGAIYNMGFREGIQQWNKYLNPGGYLAVSDITWITRERPKGIEEFWTGQYPEIDTAGNKIRQLEESGYSLAGYFYLSPESWLEHYYEPLAASFDDFLDRHSHNSLATKVVEEHRAEEELYRRFHEYYSYGFYVARKW